MALKIGRLGYLGLGIESTAGTPVASTTSIPFVSNTIRGKHEIQKDIAARASRAQNFTSIVGKQWGEGELVVNVDVLNVGFLLKLATGNENTNTIQSSVYDHVFYTTVSGNLPLTATLYNNQGVDTQIYASMAVDKLELEVKDSFMTAKATFKGFYPTSGAHTNATVSGTLLSFKDYSIRLGATLIAAAAASATPVSEFSFSLDNNLEVIHESGRSTPSRVFSKQLRISGEYTFYFESVTERDRYYNLSKQSMVVVASGTGLPGGNVESLTINIAKMVYTDVEIQTGIDNYFAIKTVYEGEVDLSQGKQYDIILRNYRSSAYS